MPPPNDGMSTPNNILMTENDLVENTSAEYSLDRVNEDIQLTDDLVNDVLERKRLSTLKAFGSDSRFSLDFLAFLLVEALI